jgi:hypothetical protein
MSPTEFRTAFRNKLLIPHPQLLAHATCSWRMDLIVYDPGRPNLLYDVAVTNPITAEVMRSNTTNRRAAWTQQRTKERWYRAAATEAAMLLHGLAIEIYYGSWGDDFSHFITLGAANSNIPRTILANYWRRRISVCLQSGVANAINKRANRLTARTLGASDLHPSHGEAFFPGLIEEQSKAFRDGVSIGRDFDGD